MQLSILEPRQHGGIHCQLQSTPKIGGGRSRVDLTVLSKGPDHNSFPCYVDKLDFEILRNKMEEEGEKKDELSRQGERRHDNDYGEQGEKDPHESSRGERQSLPWFNEETIDILCRKGGTCSGTAPREWKSS